MARRRHKPPTTECPHCGSDAETGWASSEEIEYQSVEIPDWYDDSPPPPRFTWRSLLLAVGLLAAALALIRLLWW